MVALLLPSGAWAASLGVRMGGEGNPWNPVPLVETSPGIWHLDMASEDPDDADWVASESHLTWTTGGASITLCGGVDSVCGGATMFDADPFITYFGFVQDDTDSVATIYDFVFSQAIVATPTLTGMASHDQSNSTTDAANNGVPVTPAAHPVSVDSDGNAEIFVFTLSTNGGATLVNADLDLREAFVGAAGTSEAQTPLDEGPIAGPLGSGFYDFMRIDANFSMPGEGDLFTFNGRADIVPEPGTAALLGLGLLGLAALGRRPS